MAKFTKQDRQRIIDGYLHSTGQNMFVATDFIDWLSTQPDHEAYPWFFAKDDATAAREYRVQMARQMASGLRITVRTENLDDKGSVISITTREYPAYVSPMDGRCKGGGYERTDPDDAAAIQELAQQGATALKTWLRRYGGVMGHIGVDTSGVETIIGTIQGAYDEESA